MNVAIIGLARSGYAAAKLAHSLGYSVRVSDACVGGHQTKAGRKVLKQRADELRALGIWVELGAHTPACIDGTELVVTSPGVPDSAPPLQWAREQSLPIISEIEFAVRHTNATIVGITGTNGKTTTTALIEHILAHAGTPVVAAGNIGQALSGVIDQVSAQHTLVLEMSSFQLETVQSFHAHVAVWLNLTPDHLDRYSSLEGYAAAKGRIFNNMTRDDWAVVWAHDRDVVAPFLANCPAQRVWIDETGTWLARPEEPNGALCVDGHLVSVVNGMRQHHAALSDLRLGGGHNTVNYLAACAVARILRVPSHLLSEALLSFEGLSHRLEPCGTHAGMRFVNDSKATNVDAMIKALEALPAPIALIAGGYDKGGDFAATVPLVRGKVCRLVLIGAAADALARAFDGAVDIVRAGSMDEAVAAASRDVPDGATVLLSPGCASYDMYNDFEERGDDFKRAVCARESCQD
jgi:UDP-N-acetylmuramoylalanine--D-glutamate ligase